MKLGYYSRHHIEHFSVSSIRYIPVVVYQDCLKKRWHNIRIDHLEVIRFLYVAIHELQNLFLDGSESSDFRHLGSDVAWTFQLVNHQVLEAYLASLLPSRATASEIISLVARYIWSISI